ncbi:MAG: hypothetical protein ACOYLG_04715 [Chitinophagaceae bacterium]
MPLTENKIQVADEKSYNLYLTEKWQKLYEYGVKQIENGVDFPYLRMRTGYAALLLGKYASSLKQYKKVYLDDKNNLDALYYVYLNEVNLNNILAARFYASKLSHTVTKFEKIKKIFISDINTEFSYKLPQTDLRSNAQYYRVGMTAQLGFRLNLELNGAFYNQTINEVNLLGVTDNDNIEIKQPEFYGKIQYSISGNTSLLGGYHYLHTPFNNYSYNNYITFLGFEYRRPYYRIKGVYHYGKLSDSVYNQMDLNLSIYPLGNPTFYTISKASYGNDFIFTQIAGFRLRPKFWLEANTTLGHYDTWLDRDNLYVYNDIDSKKFSIGFSSYIEFLKHYILSLNYTLTQKQLFYTSTGFNQHSITGGIQWKL